MAREKDGKTYWTKIGVAFANAQGGWRITLDALPLNGQIHLFPPRERVERAPGTRETATVADDEGYAITGDAPF